MKSGHERFVIGSVAGDSSKGSLVPAFSRLLGAYRLLRRGSPRDVAGAPRAARHALKRFLSTCTGPLDGRACVTDGVNVNGVRRTHLHPKNRSERVLIYVHGGGFVFHDVETFLPFLSRVAAEADCSIVALDYPKAPECGSQRIVQLLEDAIEDEARRAFAQTGVVHTMGDSIGGLCVLHAVATRVSELKPHVALLCPLLDPRADPTSTSQRCFAKGYFLESNFLEWYRSLARDAFGTAFSERGFDRAWIATLGRIEIWSAECDMLHDEAMAFARLVESFGHPTRCTTFRGLPHDFPLFSGRIPEADTAVKQIAADVANWFRDPSPRAAHALPPWLNWC